MELLAPPITVMASNFGTWLRTQRDKKGWGQPDVAAAADTSIPTISRLENGIRKPSRSMVVKIADALAPDDATEEDREALRADALISAGYLPDGQDWNLPEIERVPDEGLSQIIDAYRGMADPTKRERLKRIFLEAVELTDGEPADTGPSGNGTD